MVAFSLNTFSRSYRLGETDKNEQNCPPAFLKQLINPLECKGNYSATSNNMKLVHWPLMGSLLHLVQRGAGWAGRKPAQPAPRCTKIVTSHLSKASVPITVLQYNGPLLCAFKAPIKALTDCLMAYNHDSK